VRSLSLSILFASLLAFSSPAEAVTLTITTDGTVSGAVGAVAATGSQVCNPDPGGSGGGTCVFDFPAGTFLRLGADSPNTPGILSGGTGDAAGCGTSTCSFTLNVDSFIRGTFGAGQGPYASVQMVLEGTGKGSILTNNNTCQNWELGYSACTIYYGIGSVVRLQGVSVPGNIFDGFSAGGGDASGCASSTAPCEFTLTTIGTIHAAYSPLTSIAVQPNAVTIGVGQSNLFSAFGTFASTATRQIFSGVGRWTTRSPMATARFGLAAAGLNNRVYAIGGVDGFCPSSPCPFSPLKTVEMYNPAAFDFGTSDQWSPRAPMLTAREGLAVAVANGQIYALGGHTLGGGAVASMEVYDPVADTWTAMAPMNTVRAGLAAAVLNNIIYAAGGADGASTLDTLEAYDVASNTWTTKTPMTFARTGLALAAVNGRLYAIAGGPNSGLVEEYDPATDAWTTKAPMPSGRAAVTAGVIDGLIYVVAGNSTLPVPGSIDVYNPAADTWVSLGAPPTARGNFGLGVLDSRLFVAGGSDAGNIALAMLEAFRPPETIWTSGNTSVATISFNNGNALALSTGTSMIRARSVGISSGAQSATLTVATGGGGGGPQISLGLPGSASTQVGQADWGCGSFFFSGGTGTSASATINYGDGTGVQTLPLIVPPPVSGPCTPVGGGTPTGVFAFSHAYATIGTFHVSLTVTNDTTHASQGGGFDVQVAEGNGGGDDNGCFLVSTNFIAGAVPFDTVHMKVFDRATGDLVFEADVPLGVMDLGSAPAGLYRVEFTVPAGYLITPAQIEFDGICGQPIVLTAYITVADTTPPIIASVVPSSNSLWPPSHQMVPISVAVAVTDAVDPAPACSIASVTSNEPVGATSPDWSFSANSLLVSLRAERDSARVYSIRVACTDHSGNTATGVTTVRVDHDKGN